MKNKILIASLFSALFLITLYVGFLYYQTNLEKQELQKKIEIAKEEKPNKKVDVLIDQYSNQETQKDQIGELKSISSTILETLYKTNLEGDYGQVPLIEGYLSDEGIKKLLMKINPAKYQTVDEHTIELVRKADKTAISQTGCKFIEKSVYVNLIEETQAQVLLLYELSYSTDTPTGSLLIELGYQKDTEWKLTDVLKLKQF